MGTGEIMPEDLIPFEEMPETNTEDTKVTEVESTPPPDFIPFDQQNKPTKALYAEDKDAIYTYPEDTTDDELEEAVQTEVYGQPKSNFLFGVDMTKYMDIGNKGVDLLKSFGKGAAAFGVSTPMRLAASKLLQIGEEDESLVPSLEDVAQSLAFGTPVKLTEKAFMAGVRRFEPPEVNTPLQRATQDMALKILDKSNEILSNEFFQIPEGDKAAQVAFDIGGASGSMLAAVGMTWLTKNPMAASALFGDIAGSEAYIRARTEGKSPDEARRIGWQAFAVEGGLEYIGLDWFTKAMHGSKTLARVGMKMATEFGQEFSQELGGEIVAKINGLETGIWEDIFKQAWYAGALGLITGGLVGSIQVMKENRGLVGEWRKAGFSDEELDIVFPVLMKAEVAKHNIENWSLRSLANQYAEIQDRKYIKGSEALTDEEKYRYIDPRVERALAAETFNMEEMEALPLPTEVKEPKLSPEVDLAVRGRLNKLNEELSALNKEAKKIFAQTEKEPDVKLEDKLDKINDSIYEREVEKLGIELGRTQAMIGAPEIEGEKKIVLRASTANAARLRHARVQIAKYRAGIKEGAATTRKDIRSFQKYLVNVINASDALTPNQKKTMLNSLPAIQTQEKLSKKVDILESRIAELENANFSRIFKDASRTVLKKSIKKKFDVKTKQVFDELLRLNKEEGLDPAEFQLKYDPDDPSTILKYDVAMLKSPFVTLPQLKQIYFDLQKAYNSGVDALTAERQAAKEEQKVNENKIIADLSGNGKALKFDPNKQRQVEKMKGRKFTWATGDLTLYSRLKILASNSRSKFGRSFLENYFDTFNARQTYETVYQQFGPQFRAITQRVYGLKNAQASADKWMEDLSDSNNISWKVTDDITGEETEYSTSLSRAEMRKKWMEWQRPTGRRTLENKHNYTEDTIKEFEKVLTEEDMAFMKEQFKIYDELYNLMSPLYSYLTGKNLPYEESYSHLFTLGQNDPKSSVVDMMAKQGGLAGFFNPSLTDDEIFKTATGASSGLRNVPDIFAMEKYIRDVAYFMGYADFTAKFEKYFGRGSKDIRENVKYHFGESMLNGIDYELKRLSQGGFIGESNPSYKWLSDFTMPTVRAYLSNPVIGVKQLTSMFSYMTEMPTTDFIAGLADLPRAVASGDINILVSSVFAQARGNTFERELAFVKRLAEDNGKIYGSDRKTKFFDSLLGFMRMGDRASIYAGGWALYKYDTEVKGMSSKEALDHFVEFSASTQQSTDIDQLPPVLSSSNPIARLVSLFKQAPYQYMNAMRVAISNRKRMAPVQVAKRLFVLQALMPMIFQFIGNGFKWKWPDEVRAAILGQFNDLIVVGTLTGNFVNYLYAKAMDEDVPEWRSDNDLVDSVAKSAHKTMELLAQLQEDGGLELEETLDLIKELSTAMAPIGGTISGAGRYAATAARGLLRAGEGEYVDALRNMMGFSNYVVEKAVDEE